LGDPQQFPIAVRAGSGNVSENPDLITSKLAALHFYQLAIPAPKAPEAGPAFDLSAARGRTVFNGKAQCARCHVPPLFTEPGLNMHTAEEIGIDDFQARRSPTGRYRTAPLKGLFAHEKGGFYHDGRFSTLRAVVEHYDGFLKTGLTEQEKNDLVPYLRTL
jgi:cytochrome c peroxidase